MQARLIILGIRPGRLPEVCTVSALTARRAASGQGCRPDDPRRAATVEIMQGGIDVELENRCVEAAAMLRRAGHETPEIQAVFMSTVRLILEHANKLKPLRPAPAPMSPPDFAAEEAIGEPSALGGYLAGVDAGSDPKSETGA
ncbi:MAG: hypothetical protein ACYTBJ_18320 [Planctomycetota bacterium]|jgi:hypothetical protein